MKINFFIFLLLSKMEFFEIRRVSEISNNGLAKEIDKIFMRKGYLMDSYIFHDCVKKIFTDKTVSIYIKLLEQNEEDNEISTKYLDLLLNQISSDSDIKFELGTDCYGIHIPIELYEIARSNISEEKKIDIDDIEFFVTELEFIKHEEKIYTNIKFFNTQAYKIQ
jgi:hypothetical protein